VAANGSPASSASTATSSPTAPAPNISGFLATKAPASTPTPTPTPVPVRGQYLLYQSGVDTSTGFMPQIWVVKADGTGNRKIADGPNEPMASPPTHEIDAVWSKDGSVLHIVKYLTGNTSSTYCLPQITNVPIDGGSAQTLNVSLTNHDDDFLWSPDGTKIAFRRWVGQPTCVQNTVDNRTNLMMMNADGSNVHAIASNVTYGITAWTSDGSALVGLNADFDQAVRVNPSTGAATAMGPSNATSIAVSPDGSGIAFVTSGRLHVVGSNGTGAVDLGAASSTDYGPIWSPDGTAIAVQRQVSGTTKVVVIHVPSPAATLLYGATNGLNGFPCWAPTSARVAISVNGGPIVVVNANGTSAAPLSGLTDVRLLSWQP
jgi:Tol biopolymer transport system component